MIRKITPDVVITHLPTGIQAACTTERTERHAKEKAMKLLRSRLWAAQNLPARPELVATYELPDAEPYPNEISDCRDTPTPGGSHE